MNNALLARMSLISTISHNLAKYSAEVCQDFTPQEFKDECIRVMKDYGMPGYLIRAIMAQATAEARKEVAIVKDMAKRYGLDFGNESHGGSSITVDVLLQPACLMITKNQIVEGKLSI